MIYLDMDGVQADFNAGARKFLDMEPEAFEQKYGAECFWYMIQSQPNFYANLPPMLDVDFLWDYVSGFKHATLTALPRSFPEEADKQKRLWVSTHYDMPVFSIIGAKNKAQYAKPGDILIDDRIDVKKGWQKEGGIFIHHVSAYETINQLQAIESLYT